MHFSEHSRFCCTASKTCLCLQHAAVIFPMDPGSNGLEWVSQTRLVRCWELLCDCMCFHWPNFKYSLKIPWWEDYVLHSALHLSMCLILNTEWLPFISLGLLLYIILNMCSCDLVNCILRRQQRQEYLWMWWDCWRPAVQWKHLSSVSALCSSPF